MKRLILFISLCLPMLATAEQTVKIELVLFKHINHYGLVHEKWPNHPLPVETQNAISLDDSPFLDYELLPETEYDLDTAVTALNKAQEYQVLYHRAWVQPIDKRGQTASILLSGGATYEDLPDPLAQMVQSQEVFGTLKSHLAPPYYALKLDLTLTEPVAQLLRYIPSRNRDKVALNEDWQAFTLHATRRLKPRQVYYIDNPLFGALIKMTPVV